MKISYIWHGKIKDTKENWLYLIGDNLFYALIDSSELIKVTESVYVQI